MQPITVNGAPGIVLNIDGHPYWVAAMEVRDGRVDRMYTILNPAKLSVLDRHIDLV